MQCSTMANHKQKEFSNAFSMKKFQVLYMDTEIGQERQINEGSLYLLYLDIFDNLITFLVQLEMIE
jgi:hypothetical protein